MSEVTANVLEDVRKMVDVLASVREEDRGMVVAVSDAFARGLSIGAANARPASSDDTV